MKYKFISNLADAKDVEKLYIDSFPPHERVAFSGFFSGVFDGFSLVAQYDKGVLVGMLHFICTPDFIHLNYFAILPIRRGAGYGTKCLNWIKRHYKNYPIVVDVEVISDTYPNNDIRIKRQNFYRKNGFKNNTCVFEWEGEEMTYMSYKKIDETKFLKHITHIFPTITNIKNTYNN